jgi:hypothetical protein
MLDAAVIWGVGRAPHVVWAFVQWSGQNPMHGSIRLSVTAVAHSISKASARSMYCQLEAG